MDERVVVVDDDAVILKNANLILSEAGFKVTCLKSGRLLTEYIAANPTDIKEMGERKRTGCGSHNFPHG